MACRPMSVSAKQAKSYQCLHNRSALARSCVRLHCTCINVAFSQKVRLADNTGTCALGHCTASTCFSFEKMKVDEP